MGISVEEAEVLIFSATKRFSTAIYLNSNNSDGWSENMIAAFGARDEYHGRPGTAFHGLETFLDQHKDWIFGHYSYELNNETDGIRVKSPAEDGFGMMYFFVPQFVIRQSGEDFFIGGFGEYPAIEFARLLTKEQDNYATGDVHEILPLTSRESYISNAAKLKAHIQRGDIYEVNYCIEFAGTAQDLDPISVYENLNAIAASPFSALYRENNSWIMCASLERFIRRDGERVISQPIKGTIQRGRTKTEDEQLANKLQNDPKERSENIMITDLVRNDLSRIAQKGTVTVTELCGVHTFRTVHQMISTVECKVRPGVHPAETIRVAFPMGSMTGAPKIRAMQLISEFEGKGRGIYSGSIGYFTPERDFDFNVVIRSITWNAENKKLSIRTGSAITSAADPQKEYEECLVKAEAMMDALKRV